MIEELHIRSLGVIESSTLHLGPGLTVISGETGAGKTMLVTALGLLLGGRADSGAVRRGASQARVEGTFDVATAQGLAEAVDEVGGSLDEGRLVLARNVNAEGRSRAWVGGAGVPAASLARVAEPLVAVHGQSDQHRLLQTRAQREALDRFGGPELATAATQWHELFVALVECERELSEVSTQRRERAREADQLKFGLDEIARLDPQPGEDLELAAEESRLGFADTLRGAAEAARELLSSDLDTPDALRATAAAKSALEAVREHDDRAGALADRLTEVNYLLVDVATEVASYAAALETDPVRLAAVSERRAALTALTRKYGDSIDDVRAWAQTAAPRLLELEGTDDHLADLRNRRSELRAVLAEAGTTLTRLREAAAVRLSEAVTVELGSLAMGQATLTIEVTQREEHLDQDRPGAPLHVGDRTLAWHSHGFDDIEFLLAANAGGAPRPLHKGVSGGELSRVMLALEVALADTTAVPTMVFDEVDAGVGGKAAIEVGRRLAQLSQHTQVLVVTHLPQVAAFADHHVVVEKSSDGTVTTSGLKVLQAAERELELSRMLAGLEDSATARAHARELLDLAQGVSQG